jgi:sugar lactone lactonase YvrE
MSPHSSSIEIVAGGLHMPECPRWHDEQLWFSDIRGDAVHRVDDGHVSVVHRFPDGEEPAGLGSLSNWFRFWQWNSLTCQNGHRQ